MRGDLRLFNPLDAEGAFLHHAAHPHRDVRIFLHLGDVGRAFFGEGRDVLTINPEFAGNFLYADRALIVIEEIEAADLKRAIVRAITGADATVVGHHVHAVFAVDRGIARTNRFARRVLAVLAHHRLMDHLGIFRILAVVLVELFLARVVAIDPQPVHRAPVLDLQFSDDRNVVLGLARDHARAATGANV